MAVFGLQEHCFFQEDENTEGNKKVNLWLGDYKARSSGMPMGSCHI